jgi:hypothetical protein
MSGETIAGWKCGRRGGRPSRAMCVATGFMPGIRREEATIAGWKCGRRGGRPSRAVCVATGFMPGISRDGATTRKSSLPRYVRSDWLYARNQQGRCDYRGVKPLATLVATGFMPGWIAGWKCGRRGGRPSRAVCVATGFMPGISRDEATIAEVVPPARCA